MSVNESMDEIGESHSSEAGFPWWQKTLAYLLAFGIIIMRRPDAVLHAQFFAEDGHVWFADAYNLGWWASLFRAQDGYFQTFPRLGAAFALLFPLRLAPLALNLIAISIEALPVGILLSSRLSTWGDKRFRILLVAIYVALPNCREMGAIITSSQWILAFCAFLVLSATPPKGILGRTFDIGILALCGLTGPFCFFLLPIALFIAWKLGQRWRWIESGIFGALCCLQAWGLLVVNPAGRAHSALGANPWLFLRMLGAHVYLGTLLGSNGLAARAGAGMFIFLALVAVGGTLLLATCLRTASLPMRLFIVFAFLLFFASLVSPAAYPPEGMTRWELLANVGGIRYWFLPTLAFAWCLVWCAYQRRNTVRAASLVLLIVMLFGIVRDWSHPRFKDLHYREFADSFEAASPGTIAVVPENPDGWNMRLVKRTSF